MCQGSGGGRTAMCSYTYPGPPTDGECNNLVYGSCVAGNPGIVNPGACGGSTTWSCDGVSGGSSATNCSKANAGCTAGPSVISGPIERCTNFSGTYYKVNYYTQTYPELLLSPDDRRTLAGIGLASFQQYLPPDNRAEWAQPVLPPTPYTDSSCTAVVTGPIS